MLCAFAHHSGAKADTLVLRMDKTFSALAKPAQETPLYIGADRLQSLKDSRVEAMGNAVLRMPGQSVKADHISYVEDTKDLDAQGSVLLNQDGNTMSGPHLNLNLDTDIGAMEHPAFYLAENGGHGSADMMHIHDRQHYTLDNATYTTCPADSQDWLLKMHGMEIDRERQVGTAHHAWVEFKGIPILYSPWMDFPLNVQRKSGLLAPILGSTTTGGREITLPYYWNIAPNYDATIAPRMMTKRGVQLNNEFRYLQPDYSGELQLDVLPNDTLANRSRSHIYLVHQQSIADGLKASVNLNHASDDAYFRDLGSTVNVTSQVNLLQEVAFNYSSAWWNAAARLQRYQTLQDPAAPIAAPYKRLPQLSINTQHIVSDANLAFYGEFVDFSHPALVNGQRLVLNPSISYPLINAPSFYVTPKVAVHATSYSMGANNTATLPNSSRILPMLSIDSGLAMERDLNLFGDNYLHTLEPRAFYVYVPYTNQNLLPNFESAQAGFDFTQMFTENRFFGNDRVGDANHVTLAVTSRLLEQQSGVEHLKLMLGQRLSFKTPQVNLIAPAITTTNKSDVLLAASGKVTRAWSFDSEFQYDPNQSHSQRYNIASRYRPEMGKSFDLGYRFDRNTLRQVNLTGQWPLRNHWSAVGRLNYSLQDGKTLDSLVGLEYNRSCWTMRFVVQRFTIGASQANTGIFLQLELNDFVSVGVDPVKTLKQSVPSYIKIKEKSVNQPDPVLR